MYYLYYNGHYYRIIKDLCKFDVEHLTRTNYIKKQSENVFDLIEVGDLIRYDNEFMGTYILGEVYLNCGELETRDEQRIKHLDIYAIYKPNKKGDYIKVWERENENDR